MTQHVLPHGRTQHAQLPSDQAIQFIENTGHKGMLNETMGCNQQIETEKPEDEKLGLFKK